MNQINILDVKKVDVVGWAEEILFGEDMGVNDKKVRIAICAVLQKLNNSSMTRDHQSGW